VPRVGKERQAGRPRGAESRRRAQLGLALLGWLEGFEADGGWWTLDAPAPIAVDGRRLARARRTANVLRRDHAAALAALVGDLERWWAAVGAVLARLGDRVHRGGGAIDLLSHATPRTRRAARELATAQPALADLIAAAASVWATRPERLDPVIRWLAARGEAVAALRATGAAGIRLVLLLARLAQDADAADGVDALIALVRVDAPGGEAVRGHVNHLLHALRGHGALVPFAAPRSTRTVLAWIERLAARDAARRRRALAMLARVDLAGALAPWRAWWDTHAPRLARTEALIAQGGDRHRHLEHLRRVIEGVERLRGQLPPYLHLADALEAVDTIAAEGNEPHHRAVLRVLGHVPPTAPLARANLLRHAGEIATLRLDRRVATLWDAIADELDAGASPRLLGLWQESLDGKATSWREHALVRALPDRAAVRRFARALAALAVHGPLDATLVDRTAILAAVGLDPEPAAAIAQRLAGVDGALTADVARAAVRLGGLDPARIGERLASLLELTVEQPTLLTASVDALCEHAAADAPWLFGSALVAGRGGALVEAAFLAAQVPRRSWPQITVAAPATAWIAAYPPALHDALARLAAVDPDASSTAAKRLASDLPDRAALEREAAALRTRAPLGDRAAARLRNLEARIAAPRPPSPARLANLARKLEATAATVGLARFTAALTEVARARVISALGIDRCPIADHDRRGWTILLAVAELEGADRALARRLLAARRGPPPWDLRDEPVNAAYLERLRGRGVDPAAWLDDAPRTVIAGDGAPVELAFAHDPLEVFAMGAHFATCLSPGASNFFSVIANAADVNKRVLYARRGGAVVGRCLLALTDTADLLTFHAYAHDPRLRMDQLTDAFARALAAQMGVRRAARGGVATLLARAWYDDGPRHLGEDADPLAGRGFLDRLATVTAAELVTLLEATLGAPVDDRTLPRVVALWPLQARAELVRPLAPSLLAHRAHLPDATLLEAARMALALGEDALADRLLDGPAARLGEAHCPWYVGGLVARTRPSQVLAWLRASRERGVRGWGDERGDRLAVAAVAFETLRRPRQAAELYRLAIADAPFLRDELAPRLAALS